MKYKLPKATIYMKESAGLYSEKSISSPSVAAEMIQKMLGKSDREVVIAVNLNNQLQPVNFTIVAVGGLNNATIDIPNIFKTAILSNAHAIMLFHNHPSGNLTPSEADIEFTKRVAKAGKLIGIELLDHVIVSNISKLSMKSEYLY